MERVLISEINDNDLNKKILVKGWIRKVRKLGSLIFMDIIDRYDILQVVVNKDNKDFDRILHLPKETVVELTGVLQERKDKNPKLKTGNYELILDDLIIDNIPAKESPLIIAEVTDANEDIRLQYRYLDLRRPNMQRMLKFRSDFIFAITKYLIERNFIEIETPCITKITPEGANGFIIPYRKKANTFYTLDQSPQIYKQLLMLAGMQRYFQIAKCFRDEDMRLDRQPEFTQLDVEMSFTCQEDVLNLIETMFHEILGKMVNLPATPFVKITYDDAIRDYGSDKPDLRADYKITDLTKYFNHSNVKVLTASEPTTFLESCVFNNVHPKPNDIVALTKLATDKGAKGLVWIEIKDGKVLHNNAIANKVEQKLMEKVMDDFNFEDGLILMVNDSWEVAKKAMGNVRFQALRTFNLVNPDELKFCWVVDFPLFEWGEEANRYVAAHHPFTSPNKEWINSFEKNLKMAKADAYDLVLNGFEVGGGSIRIHDKAVQHRLFQALGMSEEEIKAKFGFLLEAFNYGVPPHGGIALGLDRLLMLLLKADSIREVIAFPKNSWGLDLMLEAPNKLTDEELSKYHVKNVNHDGEPTPKH